VAISDGSFLENNTLQVVAETVKKNKSKLHIMGLVGRGTVHSSIEHLYALMWFAKAKGLKEVYLHVFSDGRDSPPTSGLGIIKEINEKIGEIGIGSITSIAGRYFAMDRDNRWDRTRLVYQALVDGAGQKTSEPLKTISDYYQKGITDEFFEPFLITNKEGEVNLINEGDAVIFFNFRPDRARQLTRAFVDPTFNNFKTRKYIKNLQFVTMTSYEKNLPVLVAFPPPNISFPLSSVLSTKNFRQLHIGETEKYAHVTYFFNGGREDPFPGEDRVHIPSPKIATYDKKPEMSAIEITDHVCDRLLQKIYDVYIINFANADMVAHTGDITATIKAIETLDACLKKICNEVLPLGGAVIITADHGNAESMYDSATQSINAEHTTNPVPFIIVSDMFKNRLNLKLPTGILSDVAPTALSLLSVDTPGSMTGRNLLPE